MVYRTFPFRLYSILEDSAKDEEESTVISWMPDGKTFKIHDLEAFKERVLPKYLPKQSKYKSFKRQLQYYGFTNHGSNTYGHHSFLRDEKSLLSRIEHRAFKKTKLISSTTGTVASSSKPNSSDSLTQDSKALKQSGKDAENTLSSIPSSHIFGTKSSSSTSATTGSTASLLLRDTLGSSAFAAPGLHNHLLLSLAAGAGLPGQSLAAQSTLTSARQQQAADDALLLSSMSQSSSSSTKDTTSATNGMLSSLWAARQLSSPLTSSLVPPSTSALLALELEYQRQRQQGAQEAAALRARLLLSLATTTNQTPEQKQEQQRRQSLERLAVLNGLGTLQKYHEV